MEGRDTYGRVVGRIKGREVDENSTGRPIKSTNLDPWKLSSSPMFPETPRDIVVR